MTRPLRLLPLLFYTLCVAACQAPSARHEDGAAYGLEARPVSAAYLKLPHAAGIEFPEHLSETGAFANLRSLEPAAGLIPYDVALAFWSDGAQKTRWMAVPAAPIAFSPTGEWRFPTGSVFVKTFDLPVDARRPDETRRLETRLLVVDGSGGVAGAVYKWREDLSDADLLEGSLSEDITVRDANGRTRTQTWYYPSREDCLECHRAAAGGVLGVKTRQLNREIRYPSSGVTDNQLRALNHVGLFAPAFDESDLERFDVLATPDDTSRSLDDRARSYLDANCSQCHRPGGVTANFDARYDTPPERQNIIDGHVIIDEGIDRARVISPHDIWRSIAYMRVNTVNDIRMPPLARLTVDKRGVALLEQWVDSLPGEDVLAPPTISPAGGRYDAPVTVSLTAGEPGAEIHYTLDGSTPGSSDPLYAGPIEIEGPTVLRARAYKEGFMRSIAAQEVFVVTP